MILFYMWLLIRRHRITVEYFSLRNSLNVLPVLSVDSLIIGIVDFFLALYLTFLDKSIFLAVKEFLSK